MVGIGCSLLLLVAELVKFFVGQTFYSKPRLVAHEELSCNPWGPTQLLLPPAPAATVARVSRFLPLAASSCLCLWGVTVQHTVQETGDESGAARRQV